MDVFFTILSKIKKLTSFVNLLVCTSGILKSATAQHCEWEDFKKVKCMHCLLS